MGDVCWLSASVRQLHSGYTSLFMNEADDSTQHFDVPVRPDAEVLRADSRLGKNCRCLSKYQSGATDGATAKMNEMPIVGVSIVARVLDTSARRTPDWQTSGLESRADQTGRAWCMSFVSYVTFQ